jgi:sugar lactone lactonase YvrE
VGTTTTLASGLQYPAAIAVGSAGVYWTDTNDETVMAVGLSGGTPTTLASGNGNGVGSNVDDPVSLTVDSKNVYWTNGGNASVMSVPVGGGSVTTLSVSPNDADPDGIAVTASAVFFGADGNGTIQELTPK